MKVIQGYAVEIFAHVFSKVVVDEGRDDLDGNSVDQNSSESEVGQKVGKDAYWASVIMAVIRCFLSVQWSSSVMTGSSPASPWPSTSTSSDGRRYTTSPQFSQSSSKYSLVSSTCLTLVLDGRYFRFSSFVAR